MTIAIERQIKDKLDEIEALQRQAARQDSQARFEDFFRMPQSHWRALRKGRPVKVGNDLVYADGCSEGRYGGRRTPPADPVELAELLVRRHEAMIDEAGEILLDLDLCSGPTSGRLFAWRWNVFPGSHYERGGANRGIPPGPEQAREIVQTALATYQAELTTLQARLADALEAHPRPEPEPITIRTPATGPTITDLCRLADDEFGRRRAALLEWHTATIDAINRRKITTREQVLGG